MFPGGRSLQTQEHDGLQLAASSVEEAAQAFVITAKDLMLTCRVWALAEEFPVHRAVALGMDARWQWAVVSVVSVWKLRFLGCSEMP